MAVPEQTNPLLSASKNSDSRLQVQLHPLVILTISDYITRHSLRKQQGPIVGAILGSQHGRDITMEQAFECKLEETPAGDVVIDASWFHDRLQQYKDVHKAPPLDLVGWFTLAAPSGPIPQHLPIHQQLLTNYNESALLLLFHPKSVASEDSSRGGKLPLTIYESVLETSTTAADDGDKTMENGGDGGPQHSLRFQELPYTIETGEAEMISVDSVARGGANAARLDDSPTATADKPSTTSPTGKGKAKAPAPPPLDSNQGRSSAQTNGTTAAEKEADLILSPEDSDHIASLTAKANAIRMLQQRISLMKSYLHRLPACYLTDPKPSTTQQTPSATQKIPPDLNLDHQVLRQTSALLARLPLLTAAASPSPSITSSSSQPHHTSTSQLDPTPASAPAPSPHVPTLQHQRHRLQSSVALTSLLGSMGSTLSTAQNMGRKAQVFEQGKNAKDSKTGLGGGVGGSAAFAGQIPGFADGYGGTAGVGGLEEDGYGYGDSMEFDGDG